MAAIQRKAQVSKVLEDRVRPDAELVGQVLEPGRTSETVQYPDPEAPEPRDRNEADGLDSVAEAQMARRTDAGAAQPGAAYSATGGALIWLIAAVATIAFALLLIA